MQISLQYALAVLPGKLSAYSEHYIEPAGNICRLIEKIEHRRAARQPLDDDGPSTIVSPAAEYRLGSAQPARLQQGKSLPLFSEMSF